VPNPDIVLTADDSGYIVIWDVQVCCKQILSKIVLIINKMALIAVLNEWLNSFVEL
jgi:hypothetical protein